MSNVSGKAYAMNLITPVYVKTTWLLLLFFPGIIITLKALSYFSRYSFSILTWQPIGIILVVAGVIFLILGLVRWMGTIKRSNELVLWGLSIASFVVASTASLNVYSTGIFGVIGITLVVIGFILMRHGVTWLNMFVFWLAGLQFVQKIAFDGLKTLSLIHYARWVILRDFQFPHLSTDQPKENLKYGYMLFFSNFNGSWTQYVDSFSTAISGGLNLIWNKNVGWKDASVETPFNGYVLSNQIETEHYYNAYPLASSNDVKSAQKVKAEVIKLAELLSSNQKDFKVAFDKAVLNLQADLSQMEPTPIVSLAQEAIERRKSIQVEYSSQAPKV